jgi:hypothetical protein
MKNLFFRRKEIGKVAQIAPFGDIYNSRIINNLAQVVTPPHDVIHPEEQERFISCIRRISSARFWQRFPGTPRRQSILATRTLKIGKGTTS